MTSSFTDWDYVDIICPVPFRSREQGLRQWWAEALHIEWDHARNVSANKKLRHKRDVFLHWLGLCLHDLSRSLQITRARSQAMGGGVTKYVFCHWLRLCLRHINRVSIIGGRRYTCNVFCHWLSPCTMSIFQITWGIRRWEMILQM